MQDAHTGISIRFIREWKPEAYRCSAQVLTLVDQAFALVMNDDRDVAFGVKFNDALTFLKSQIH